MKILKLNLNTLPVISQDKANHFIYGVLIYSLGQLLFPGWISLILVLLIAILKEYWDDKHPPHKADPMDVVWTIAGSFLGLFISLTTTS